MTKNPDFSLNASLPLPSELSVQLWRPGAPRAQTTSIFLAEVLAQWPELWSQRALCLHDKQHSSIIPIASIQLGLVNQFQLTPR